jgi:diacylglycerol kinase (ATP)
MPEIYEKTDGFKRVINAYRASLSGFYLAFKHEAAFRQEVYVALPLLVYLVFAPHNLIEKLLMLITLALVLIVELLNSAIEATVDRISLERHPLAKQAKDIASSAVFLSLSLCGVVWGSVILKHLFG